MGRPPTGGQLLESVAVLAADPDGAVARGEAVAA
jgi:hypothetical protein